MALAQQNRRTCAARRVLSSRGGPNDWSAAQTPTGWRHVRCSALWSTCAGPGRPSPLAPPSPHPPSWLGAPCIANLASVWFDFLRARGFGCVVSQVLRWDGCIVWIVHLCSEMVGDLEPSVALGPCMFYWLNSHPRWHWHVFSPPIHTSVTCHWNYAGCIAYRAWLMDKSSKHICCNLNFTWFVRKRKNYLRLTEGCFFFVEWRMYRILGWACEGKGNSKAKHFN